MGTISADAAQVFRDYSVDGNSASGKHKPQKPEVRQLFITIDATLASLGVNGAITVKKTTLAALNADKAYPANTLAIVFNDDELSGIYYKTGGIGSGTWVRSDLSLPQNFAGEIAEILESVRSLESALETAEGYRDETEEYRDQALAAAEASGDVVFFDTKADADAAVGGLPDLQIVQVLQDETLGGDRTLYRKEGGAFEFKANLTTPRTEFSNRAQAINAYISGAVSTINVARYDDNSPAAPAVFEEVANSGALQIWHFQTNGGTRRWALQARQFVAPEMFGAVGDGVADDYEAWQAVAAYCTFISGGKVLCAPNKTYLIDRVQISGGLNINNVDDITFSDCDGLSIDLNGSTLSFKGDYLAAADFEVEDVAYFSWSRAIGLSLFACDNTWVGNGRITLNCQDTTRDAQLILTGGAGVFQVGETVTQDGTGISGQVLALFSQSGVSGIVVKNLSGGVYSPTNPNGFSPNGTLTGATSGATATGVNRYGVAEQPSYCLQVRGHAAIIENIILENAQSDGLLLQGLDTVPTASVGTDATLINVTCRNNARNGMTVASFENVVAINCRFQGSGMGGGSYGGHNPMACVDVEPNSGPPVVDRKASRVHFINCEFSNSFGFLLAGGTLPRVESITLDECDMFDDYKSNAFAFSVGKVRVNGGLFRNVLPRPAFGSGALPDLDFEFSGVEFISEYTEQFLALTDVEARGNIHDCIIRLESAPSFPGRLADCRNAPNINFRNNYVFVSKDRWENQGVQDGHAYSFGFDFSNAGSVHDNTYATDLVGENVFLNIYDGAEAYNEVFQSGGWLVDAVAGEPSGRGLFAVGGLSYGGLNRSRVLQYALQGMPNSGTYRKGTYVKNTDPGIIGASPGKYVVIGWERLTNGSAHVVNVDWWVHKAIDPAVA